MNTHLKNILNVVPSSKYSPEVKEAIEFDNAAKALVEQVGQPIPPVDLESATTKDITKVHAAAVAYERDEPARAIAAKHAATLAKIADERLDEVWRGQYAQYEPLFAKQFDDGVAELKKYVDQLTAAGIDPHAVIAKHWTAECKQLGHLLGVLGGLQSVRTSYRYADGEPPRALSDQYEESSRLAYFESHNIEMRFRERVNAEHLDWWLAALNTEGVTLKWQTKAQQEAQPGPAALISDRAALAHESAAGIHHAIRL